MKRTANSDEADQQPMSKNGKTIILNSDSVPKIPTTILEYTEINSKLDNICQQNDMILKKLEFLSNQLSQTQANSVPQIRRCISVARSNSVISTTSNLSCTDSMKALNEGAKFTFDKKYPDISISWLLKRRDLSTRDFVKELMRKLFKWEEINKRTATSKGRNMIDVVRRDFIQSMLSLLYIYFL